MDHLAARGDFRWHLTDLRAGDCRGLHVHPHRAARSRRRALCTLANEGGSVGTSMASGATSFTSRLGKFLDFLNPAVASFSHETTGAFLQPTGDPALAQQMTWKVLADLRHQQSVSLSYFDDFCSLPQFPPDSSSSWLSCGDRWPKRTPILRRSEVWPHRLARLGCRSGCGQFRRCSVLFVCDTNATLLGLGKHFSWALSMAAETHSDGTTGRICTEVLDAPVRHTPAIE